MASLKHLLTPLDVTPDLFRLSEEAEEALRLRFSAIDCSDVVTAHHHLDNLSAALVEVMDERLTASIALGDVRTRLREVEASYYQEVKGIKDAERGFNGDAEHMGLKAIYTKLEGIQSYCDSAESLLKSKWFELTRRMKDA